MAELKRLQLKQASLKTMVCSNYDKLDNKSRIGITRDATVEKIPQGASLPIFLTGSFETKTKTFFKPKIPKSGKSFYRGIYMRPNKGFAYLYDKETTVFIASLHSQINPKEWIDKNYDEIIRRVNGQI